MNNLIEELGLDVDDMDVEQLCDGIAVMQEFPCNDEAAEREWRRYQLFTERVYIHTASAHVESMLSHTLKDWWRKR